MEIQDNVNLMKEISSDEVEHVLKQLTKKRTPGPDGIIYDFSMKFFNDIKDEISLQ